MDEMSCVMAGTVFYKYKMMARAFIVPNTYYILLVVNSIREFPPLAAKCRVAKALPRFGIMFTAGLALKRRVPHCHCVEDHHRHQHYLLSPLTVLDSNGSSITGSTALTLYRH
jgi:hypothetical protein